MPLGSTHDRITLWTLPWITLIAGLLDRRAATALAVGAAYLFSGLMFSGDLDIKSRQYKRWLALRWIWIPYRAIFKHRSLASHGPLIGTTLRVIYLIVWLSGLGSLLAVLGAGLGWWPWQPQIWWSQLWQWIQTYMDLLFLIWIGLELGSLNHTLSDWILSAWKRRQKQASSALSQSSPPRRSTSVQTQRPVKVAKTALKSLKTKS